MDDRFIPPPPGAVQGGQPIGYNPFPGANPAASQPPWPPAPQASWSGGAAQIPAWLAQQQQMQSPPSSSQSWVYGQQYPSQYTPYNAPTPAGSWGDATPAPSWGPATPASAQNPYPGFHSPYVQQAQQGYASNPAQDSSTGQPITASPWFNGGGAQLGGGGAGVAATGYPAFGGAVFGGGGGGPVIKKKSKRKRKSQQLHYPSYPSTPYSDPDLSLHRTGSHEVPGFGMGGGMGHPLQRSHSFGGGAYSAYQQQLQSQGEEYSARNPARRPRDWRPDYDSREGFASFIPKIIKHRSDVTEWTDPVKRSAHLYLTYKPQDPPIYHDLRFHPFLPSPLYNNAPPIEFPALSRPPNNLDFAQLATSPPAAGMRLFHPLLPWYIDVAQSHPNGVTVHDVVLQMFVLLDVPIQGRHWFNDDVDEPMRARIAAAYQERVKADGQEMRQGVKRVDFLRGRVVFEGLVRRQNGLWEIKTSRLD